MTNPYAATSRRTAGSGAIFPRDDGALIIRLTIDGQRHKRIVPRITRDDGRPETPSQHRKRAEQALAALRAELAQPATLREPWTVERYAVERYIPAVRASGRKRATIDGYERVLALYVYPHVGRIALGKLTADDVDDHDRQLAAAGLSTTTRRHARSALVRVLRHARRKGRVAEVVTDLADPLPTTNRDRTADVPELADVRALLAEAHGTRWELPIALLALLGMRRGEVLALGWGDINLDASTLTVRRNAVPLSAGRVTIGAPKSESSARTLTLAPNLVAMFRARRVEQATDRLAAGTAWQTVTDDDGTVLDLVTTDEAGRLIGPHRLTDAVRRLSARAGIEPLAPHRLRHATASHMLAEGHDIAAVAAVLGHASPAVTAAVYSHAVKGRRVVASTAMAEAVGGWS